MRLTLVSAFVFSATMITLSLNVSLIKQAFVAGTVGPSQWLLASLVLLMMFSAMILLVMCFVILGNTPLAQVDVQAVLRRLEIARLYIGVSAFMILASYGSIFLISFGLSSRFSWTLSGIGYGAAVALVLARRYHLSRFVTRRLS